MAPKRKAAAASAPTAPQDHSITKKYAGVAAYRDAQEEYIAKTAAYKTRCELAKQRLEELKQDIGSSEDNQRKFDAARSLINAASGVYQDAKSITEEILNMKHFGDGLGDIVKALEEMRLSDETSALHETLPAHLAELRETYAEMMGPKGSITSVEMQQLRMRNDELTRQNELIKSEQEALKSLIIDSCESRFPAAQSVVELPEWLSPEAENPFDSINTAVKSLEAVNDSLRTRCLELQQSEKDKQDELVIARKELASVKAKAQSVEDIRTMMETRAKETAEGAKLRLEFEYLKKELEAERVKVKEGRKERVALADTNAKLVSDITELSQQNMRLIEKNSRLEISKARATAQQSAIDDARRETTERIKEMRERHEERLQNIQDIANERVLTAETNADALATQLQQLKESANLAETILAQAKQIHEASQEAAIKATTRADTATQERSIALNTQNELINSLQLERESLKLAKHKIDKLRADLDEANQKIDLCEREKKDLRTNFQSSEQMVKDLSTALMSYKGLEGEFAEACSDIEFLKNRVMEWKDAHAKLMEAHEAENEEWEAAVMDGVELGSDDVGSGGNAGSVV